MGKLKLKARRRGPALEGAFRRAALIFSLVAGLVGAAQAQVLDVDLRTSVFHEPSSESQLTVVNPAVSIAAQPTEFLRLQAGYEADIVSGASEAVKAGPLSPIDVVSAATSFEDTRHVVSGGFAIVRENTELAATYAHGTESDYRSHAFSVRASTSFLQKNTELALSYARGFDQVCTSAFREADDPTSRSRLDSSRGCFTNAENRASREVLLDNLQVGWTQSWTPVFTTQMTIMGALQHGFLGNPYRAVVIAPAGDEALENHPENRARGALSVRGKLYVRALSTAFGAGARVYRDTWDVFSQTYELEAERYLVPGLRAQIRGRYYTQTGAIFYSDDYSGGEPVDGPRGQYWTGDRELSPMKSLLLGGRILYALKRPAGARILGALLGFSGSFGVDAIRTELEHFTWAGRQPDDTIGFLASLGATGSF